MTDLTRRENYLDKPLPSSEEAERVILGAILLDNDVIIHTIGQIEPNSFYSPLNRRIFAAMLTLFQRSSQIDPILIGEELKKEGALESIGGITTITNLTFGLPHFSNIEEYIKLVKDNSIIRDLIRTCNSITGEALAGEDDAEVILDHAEHLIYNLIDRGVIRPEASLMSQVVKESIEVAKARALTGEIIIGVSTGFKDLDTRLQGYHPKQYVLIAARPSIGKTSLATRSFVKCVLTNDEPVLLFSLEMAKEEIAERVICSELNIDSTLFRAGHLTEQEWAQAEQIQKRLSEAADFYIDDTPGINLQGVRAGIRRVNAKLRKKGKKLKLVGIDHVGLMGNDHEKRGQTREGEVSTISKGLKNTAREENITMIALSQLNRGSELRTDHKPKVSDLRESGGLEQDADVALLLYREDVYQEDPSLHTNIAEVIIGKNRNGPTGTVRLHFTRKSTRFSDMSDDIVIPTVNYGPNDFEI